MYATIKGGQIEQLSERDAVRLYLEDLLARLSYEYFEAQGNGYKASFAHWLGRNRDVIGEAVYADITDHLTADRVNEIPNE